MACVWDCLACCQQHAQQRNPARGSGLQRASAVAEWGSNEEKLSREEEEGSERSSGGGRRGVSRRSLAAWCRPCWPRLLICGVALLGGVRLRLSLHGQHGLRKVKWLVIIHLVLEVLLLCNLFSCGYRVHDFSYPLPACWQWEMLENHLVHLSDPVSRGLTLASYHARYGQVEAAVQCSSAVLRATFSVQLCILTHTHTHSGVFPLVAAACPVRCSCEAAAPPPPPLLPILRPRLRGISHNCCTLQLCVPVCRAALRQIGVRPCSTLKQQQKQQWAGQ